MGTVVGHMYQPPEWCFRARTPWLRCWVVCPESHGLEVVRLAFLLGLLDPEALSCRSRFWALQAAAGGGTGE